MTKGREESEAEFSHALFRAFYRMLTARAASRARVAREMLDWIIISPLAQRESTGESVGENAVLVLNARKR